MFGVTGVVEILETIKTARILWLAYSVDLHTVRHAVPEPENTVGDLAHTFDMYLENFTRVNRQTNLKKKTLIVLEYTHLP